MNTDRKIAPFRPLEDSQMITARDVQYWIATQKRHDQEVDSFPLHHRCDFCPLRIVIPDEQVNSVKPWCTWNA
jgi:hypothetical protein